MALKSSFFMGFVALFVGFCALNFAACSAKSQQEIDAELRKQVLMYAQKVKFTHNGEQNASENGVLMLSYLNVVLADEEESDIFALVISPKDTNTSGLKAFMDDKEAQISPLDDELKKLIITSEYANFYKLTFPFKDDSLISVRLCLGAECFELSFQKYSKSLFYRSVDVDTQYN